MKRALLAIETSTLEARVGVFDAESGERRAGAAAISERHSSNLLRLCVEVTEEAGVAIAELAAIACGAGPGSFTGLRVGYAVAKGFALPFGIPFLSVSSLQGLAWDMAPFARPGERIVPCLDAGKGQVYVALFEAAAPAEGDGAPGSAAEGAVRRLGDDWVIGPAAAGEILGGALDGKDGPPVLFAGPGAVRYRDVVQAALGPSARFAEVAGPSAEAVAAHVLPRWRRGEREDLSTAVPAYGRAPDITRPKKPA
jgi:tRNA threonylcarbamoyladenosine biosynthesis protein TsaB